MSLASSKSLPMTIPLELRLKSQSVLNAEQLKFLSYTRIMQVSAIYANRFQPDMPIAS